MRCGSGRCTRSARSKHDASLARPRTGGRRQRHPQEPDGHPCTRTAISVRALVLRRTHCVRAGAGAVRPLRRVLTLGRQVGAVASFAESLLSFFFAPKKVSIVSTKPNTVGPRSPAVVLESDTLFGDA
jgi:hypothetical protein